MSYPSASIAAGVCDPAAKPASMIPSFLAAGLYFSPHCHDLGGVHVHIAARAEREVQRPDEHAVHAIRGSDVCKLSAFDGGYGLDLHYEQRPVP